MDNTNKETHDPAPLADRHYMRWDDEGVEKIPPNETEDIKAIGELINKLQKVQYNTHRHCYTGTHARTHGIVKGTLVVPDDLPKHLKQTMFAHGGEYPVVCRYSSEPGDPGLDDRIPQPRGFAMKIFNVHGPKLSPPSPSSPTLPTQDLEFNSTPALELSDAKTTREILSLRLKHGSDKPALYKALEERTDTALQKARDEVRNMWLEATTYYSQTPYRFGDYVAKYRLSPESPIQKSLASETVPPPSPNDSTTTTTPTNILSTHLRTFHTTHPATYTLSFQLLESPPPQSPSTQPTTQPTETASKVWSPTFHPFQPVATLHIPPQNSFLFSRKAFWEDRIRVDPWLGLEGLRPLGGSNRVRRGVYGVSGRLRRRLNGYGGIMVVDLVEVGEVPDYDDVDEDKGEEEEGVRGRGKASL
ncbi:MAG: hypothetical protein M1834_008933 [Cirrosporium novae-zelandiae]|nr:MAG: hypothetical protein M1834_008933 [Cirrosporium novae-zelandiae]